MSQSAPAEPVVISSDQPSPPLGELAAAIREYVSAERLGESNRRRHDLSRRVFELCWTCRPKRHEYEMCGTDGMTARVVWTYSAISVQCRTREGKQAGGSLKPRCHSDLPTKLDRELNDIELDITRARHETSSGNRMPDENGRPLPAPATDRLLVIADRVEPQQASDGSAAVDTNGDENYVLQRDDVLILEALEGTGQAMTQVEIEAYKNTMPSRGTIGKRLERMRKAGYIRRSHGDRGGDAITNDGKAALKKTSCSTQR